MTVCPNIQTVSQDSARWVAAHRVIHVAGLWMGDASTARARRMWVRAERESSALGHSLSWKEGEEVGFEDLSPADLCFGKGAGSAELRNALKK